MLHQLEGRRLDTIIAALYTALSTRFITRSYILLRAYILDDLVHINTAHFSSRQCRTPTAPPLGAFQKAFNKLRDSISADDARSFEKTTLNDVWAAAREIEREQGERQSLRNLRRIEPFLKAIDKYSKVIEVLCNGTPYLPFVWVGFLKRMF